MGEPLVWDYVRDNWRKLVERFSINERNLGNLIPAITSKFHTNVKLIEMQHFFKLESEAGAGTAARIRASERVKNNIAWLKNNLGAFRDWMQENK